MKVAEYFDFVIEECNRDRSGRPINLPKHDQIIYYVISTRCEIDINGFESVFDQLLSEDELRFLIEALYELGSPQLAKLFDQARLRLQKAGYFDDDSMMVLDLDCGEVGFLDDIEEDLRNNESLWGLDNRLAELIPTNT